MDNFSTSRRSNIAHFTGSQAFQLMEGDIRSVDDCQKAVEGAALVVHLAALGSVPRSIADPLSSHATNSTGFLNLLECARKEGVDRFVYASSSSVYGDSKELPKTEPKMGSPLSPYAITKLTDEHYGTLYHRLHGFSTIGLRFFNVFGERQDPEGPYAAAIPRFIQRFLRKQPPQVHGDGLQSRDFTYVGNAIQAVMTALTCTDPKCVGELYNVAYGKRTTLIELIELLRSELAKLDPTIVDVPIEYVAERPGDVRDSLADISKAKNLLGFEPKYSLQEGLAKAVPWYVENWG
jgi:UDP-N-acetylglucosamine 4-epimerase